MEVTHVVMVCVALLLRNHEVPVQILARKPTVLTKVICGFLQSRRSNSGMVSQNKATAVPFHISQSAPKLPDSCPLRRRFRELARSLWATARGTVQNERTFHASKVILNGTTINSLSI
jgi:hypothetical protein